MSVSLYLYSEINTRIASLSAIIDPIASRITEYGTSKYIFGTILEDWGRSFPAGIPEVMAGKEK